MANYWEATQQALQGERPLVLKPKLTENLLQKPPFRFLHDVISEVQRNTGYAPDLFSGAELDAKSIQDRNGKMSYLQKIFDAVSASVGHPVPAQPAKVVAGLEPELTNVFLQMLADAAQQGSTGQAQTEAATNPAAQPSRAIDQRVTADQRDQQTGSASSLTSEALPPPSMPAAPPMPPLAPPRQPNIQGNEERQGSAGPRPAGAQHSKPAAAAAGLTAMILEEGQVEEEPDQPAIGMQDLAEPMLAQHAAAGSNRAGRQEDGALVRDLLQAQQSMQDGRAELQADGHLARQTGISIQRKGRDGHEAGAGLNAGNMATAATLMQQLCQSCIPVGRCLESLQADMDSMAAEHRFWAKERRSAQEKLAAEQRLAESTAVEGPQAQLAKVESGIAAALERIAALKLGVLHNDRTSAKLLQAVVAAVVH
ncbi:hypothetical protein WJX72_008820 [[Myrmecia] bisecta]|uniref:TRAF3-interacting protein 1 n=1 Tax=[Myrmecia] bisecta TaxID=41462 RepID=A0AAW1P6I0_9CHLO